MKTLDYDILTQNTKISKLADSLPVGYAAIADDGQIRAMLEKRHIPFTLQDGYIVMPQDVAEWLMGQFSEVS